MKSRFYVEAQAHTRDGDYSFIVQGKAAKALLALVNSGQKGVTAHEVAGWAYRLAAYCHDLRRRYGLAIRTDREEHPGGWHGRHVLETPVTIRRVADPEGDEQKPSKSWWRQLASGFM